MKNLTEKKYVQNLVVACLLFPLVHASIIPRTTISVEPENNIASNLVSVPQTQKRVVYFCRIGTEEIPAVQVSEVKDVAGQVTETVASVQVGEGIEVSVKGIGATWNYKSISARSGESLIDVSFKPYGKRKGYDWILTLTDKNTKFSERVRDCQEVSDE